jgi:hypothetical protein
VEGENRRLQDQLQGYERELAARRAPGVNRAIYDLLPQDAMTRGEAARAYQITFPPAANEVVLILYPGAVREFSDYRLEIRDGAGEARWREVGLRPHQGAFVVTLERGYLERGRYRLVLSGGAGGQWRPIAAYAIVID